MNKKEINRFFEWLGEIWRDTTVIEFLMRSAITKIDWEEKKFPLPPYDKWKVYKNFPDSFWNYNFEIITEKFNKRFWDKITIPIELVNLRNAMAHWIITKINNDSNETLLKFKKNKENNLEIEFSLELNKQTISQLRQSIKELRRHIINILK